MFIFFFIFFPSFFKPQKMLCNGTMHTLPEAVKSRNSPCQVLFVSFQLFSAVTSNTDLESNGRAFWTRHKLDFTTTAVDDRWIFMKWFSSHNVRISYNNSYNELENKMKTKTVVVSTEEFSGVVFFFSWTNKYSDNSFMFNHCFRPII